MQAFQYFFDTKETIPAGLAWSHYGPWHLFWLAVMVVFIGIMYLILWACRRSAVRK